MGKKRKHSETQTAEPKKKDEAAPERPKRSLFGWKDKEEVQQQTESNTDPPQVFRNKEKVMVTCSRRINYRFGWLDEECYFLCLDVWLTLFFLYRF